MEAANVFKKLEIELKPDPSRTVIRPFSFSYPEAFAADRPSRAQKVAQRVMALDPALRKRMVELLAKPMEERHRNADDVFRRRFAEVQDELDIGDIDADEALLLGAYFSQEYAFESAALFNPSIARIDDEPGSATGGVKFVLSLRGIGEGHISSVTFRTGEWGPDDRLVIDPASPHGVPPRIDRNQDGWVRLLCDDSQDASETVIFPVLPSQRQGVEDLRLVNFTDHDGVRSIIGTYTAFDGRKVQQEMLRGVDMRTFEMRPLAGAMTGYKGMALFPRRIDGQFVMLGRQDSETIWLLRSDDLYTWDRGTPIMAPKYPWEFVQLGNCGSPIEIDEGWLVFTHGVGMVRGYCIGACLLDKADPSRVLARTPSPLLFPSAEQRGGYVPNVTYSCGGLLQGRRILLPYAIGDEYTAFATAQVDDILSVMAPA
ncbi:MULTISPECIES: glycoside hydrolase family 130 protein [Sphingomonas]|uniref:glycoside hydrolase family 130 protein n=1 Tax=Sphingomonas TaxID=13687 RepID=UPI0006F7E75F|nr:MULTISPECIES: glycoside hydrolase family 130 protein [Sphingomonas]KQM91710.1 glycosidase [Sphingomonas sp. Leaf226]MDY0967150.1 glycoside hydrolase family 130 protein [Sphingomonas sp. CFBP9021]USR02121.1 glycoside hydrolase family 130 protein [Sphingomonas aerolata]